MSRGDEFDRRGDEPMRRGDYDRGGDEWDQGRPTRRPPSGVVTAIGILNIVFGALSVITALIMMFAASMIFGGAVDVAKAAAQADPKLAKAVNEAGGGFAGMIAGAAVFVGVVTLLIAGLWILTGVGVLQRKGWARIVTLVLGALMLLGGLCSIPGLTVAPLNALLQIVILLGYGIFVYVILLNKQYAAEFR
jgi:hypothetical protein